MNTRNVIATRIVAIRQERITTDDGDQVYSVESIDLDNGYRIVFAGVDGPHVTGTVVKRPPS